MNAPLFALAIVQARTDSLPSGIVNTVNQFTDFLLGYLLALTAIGALAMALIEAWKKIFDSRTKFQAKRCTAWIEKSFPEIVLDKQVVPPPPATGLPRFTLGPVGVLADIIQLGTGVSRAEAYRSATRLHERRGRLHLLHAFTPDPAHAIFALEIERMMGALQEAGDAALMAPRKYPALYAFMTIGGGREEVNRWYRDGETGFTEIAAADKPSADDRRKVKDLTDIGAQLRQVMKRRLDSFQLYTGDRWASWNQASAVVVGAVLMFAVLVSMYGTDGGTVNPLTLIPMSLLGGVLSPVAKDIVTSLKRVKSG